MFMQAVCHNLELCRLQLGFHNIHCSTHSRYDNQTAPATDLQLRML